MTEEQREDENSVGMLYTKEVTMFEKEAKEIIKGLLSFVDSLGNYSGGIFAKAEQFLNSEVEK